MSNRRTTKNIPKISPEDKQQIDEFFQSITFEELKKLLMEAKGGT